MEARAAGELFGKCFDGWERVVRMECHFLQDRDQNVLIVNAILDAHLDGI